MMGKKKADKPALSFADSSIQGQSADPEDEEDEVTEQPQPKRTTRMRSFIPKWLVAGSSNDKVPADDDVSSDENFVALPQLQRRSIRNQRNQDGDWQPADENDVSVTSTWGIRFFLLLGTGEIRTETGSQQMSMI